MPTRSLPLLLALAVFATGCSTIRENTGLLPERDVEYREARELPPLMIPEDLDASRVGSLLPIPQTANTTVPDDFEVPRPGSLLARDPGDPVKIQKLADRRWLLITDRPASVWPRLKQFLLDNGVPLVEEVPATGLLRTDWMDVEATGHRDAVRTALLDTAGAGQHRLEFRVEQGVRTGSTEIHLRQQQGFTIASAVPDTSTNSEAEARVLGEVGGYLAAIAAEPGAESAVSMLAQEIGSAAKAVDERVDGRPALRLNLDFARAWATVGQALANAEVEVTDLNRDQATFYVALTEELLERDGDGFFARVIPFLGDDERIPLQIHVEPAPGNTTAYHVLVVGAEGGPVDDTVGSQVLALIREYAG